MILCDSVDMSLLEEMRSFVSFCQASGLIPFIMKEPTKTRSLIFSFTFKSVTTWWFITIIFLQLIVVIVVGNSLIDITSGYYVEEKLPVTVSFFGGSMAISSLATIVSARWIVLRRYRSIETALDIIQDTRYHHHTLDVHGHKSTLTFRFVIGAILIMMNGITSLYLMAPFMVPAFIVLGTETSTLILFVNLLTFIIQESPLLLMHLSYYVITFNLQSLCFLLKRSNGDALARKKETCKQCVRVACLEKSIEVLDSICRSASELNDTFSIPSLIYLITKFISLMANTFSCLFGILNSNSILGKTSAVAMLLSLADWLKLIIIFSTADMPIHEVRRLRELALSLLSSRRSKPTSENSLIMNLLQKLDEERIRLSAAGLFGIGMHLIPTLAGTVATYMVVLVQD